MKGRRGTELEGIVERRRVARGSKSDHVAVVVRTDTGVFTLRRRGGHAFRDPALERLVGRRMKGEGSVHGTTFIADRIEAIADRPDAPEVSAPSARRLDSGVAARRRLGASARRSAKAASSAHARATPAVRSKARPPRRPTRSGTWCC